MSRGKRTKKKEKENKREGNREEREALTRRAMTLENRLKLAKAAKSAPQNNPFEGYGPGGRSRCQRSATVRRTLV